MAYYHSTAELPNRYVQVDDTYMSYFDSGSEGSPLNPSSCVVVFLHGNPTSNYLWRNVIPHVAPSSRCLAPDLIGMGRSYRIPAPNVNYDYDTHSRYLDLWFDAMGIGKAEGPKVILVLHDWGSGLGFWWAFRHQQAVAGIVYMEAIVSPIESWLAWPDGGRKLFQAMRSTAGEQIVLEKNIFVERILPSSVIRNLSDSEMAVYRRPFQRPGEDRRPTLTWPRMIPIEGSPVDVVDKVKKYSEWLAKSSKLPKLFINADPGSILIGPQREFCRKWPNQQEITVRGTHFIQEDSPHEIGAAIRSFITKSRSLSHL